MPGLQENGELDDVDLLPWYRSLLERLKEGYAAFRQLKENSRAPLGRFLSENEELVSAFESLCSRVPMGTHVCPQVYGGISASGTYEVTGISSEVYAFEPTRMIWVHGKSGEQALKSTLLAFLEAGMIRVFDDEDVDAFAQRYRYFMERSRDRLLSPKLTKARILSVL